MWNYVLPIGSAFVALLQLAKDWGGHKTTFRRAAVFVLIIVLGVGGAVNNYYTSKRTTTQHSRDQAQIAGLQKAVETANRNQQDNTAQFITAFSKLSQKVGDLQAQLTTIGLKKEAIALRAELEATQKALNPPKASLIFGFFLGPAEDVEPRSVWLPLKDGAVNVDFVVLNNSDVGALDGQYVLIICNKCKYASEPDGFLRVSGSIEQQRNHTFGQLLPHTHSQKLTLAIVPPRNATEFEIGFDYRCRTCVSNPPTQKGTVYIVR